MAFIIDENGNYIPVLGETGGGGGGSYTLPVATTEILGGVKIDGTTIDINENGVISASATPITIDDTLSNSSTNPVQNKVLYPSLSNFIPDGTIYTLNSNGSGDFTTLTAAIAFLENKWSNGTVTLSIPADVTIQETNTVTINSANSVNMNIPCLKIEGGNASTSIIENTQVLTSQGSYMYIYGMKDIRFKNLTLKAATYQTGSTRMIGLRSEVGSNVTIDTCNFENLTNALLANDGGSLHLKGSITMTNSEWNGLTLQNCGRADGAGVSLTFSNIRTAMNIDSGGYLSLANPTFSFSSITTKCNVTPNTITTSGIAMGFTLS